MAHRPADEIFSVTRGGKRNRLIVRPGSRADNRAIANASRRLRSHTTRGGSSSQMSEAIQCDSAYRAMLAGWIAIVGCAAATTFHFVMQCLAALFCRKPFGSHHFQARRFAKTLCSFTRQKYVFGLFHDRTCRKNRIARAA